MPIADIYTNTIKLNEKTLFATWEPTFPIKLGDYGIMDRNIFVQLGNILNIKEFKGFKPAYRKSQTKDAKTFSSKQGVEFHILPQTRDSSGNILTNSSIDVNFSSEKAVFFNAAECKYELIENKIELGEKILKIHNSNRNTWRREFVVVTDRVVAKRTLIIISEASDFSISLEAKSSIPKIDLANSSLGLSVKSQKSNGYKVISEKDLTLLVGLSKIQSRFWWSPKKINPLINKLYTNSMLESIIDSNSFSDSYNEELFFDDFTKDLSQ